jgi:WD40 repeat protein
MATVFFQRALVVISLLAVVGLPRDSTREVAQGQHGVVFNKGRMELSEGQNGQPEATPAGRPELVTQTGHTSKVDAMAFDASGDLFASGGADNTVRIWAVASGRELRTLTGHGAGVAALSFSRDGKSLASGGNDKSARVWDVNSGAVRYALPSLPAPVKSIALNPEGKLVALGDTANTVSLWDLSAQGGPRPLGKHPGWVVCLTFSPDGRLLASGGADGTIKLWDVLSGKEIVARKGHTDRITAAAFSDNGSLLASAGRDGAIKLWDVAKRRELRTVVKGGRAVLAVSFLKDGTGLSSISADREAKVWDAAAGRELRSSVFDGQLDYEVASFSGDGTVVAVSNGNKTVDLRRADSGAVLRVFDTVTSGVYAVAFSSDGKWFATGTKDNLVRLWDLQSGTELTALAGHSGWVTSLAFSPDGKRLASGSMDGTVKVWDIESQRPLLTFRGHKDSVYAIAFAPGGEHVASGGLDQTVQVWDWQSGRLERVFTGHRAEVTSLVFGRNRPVLMSGGADGAVKCWDLAAGREQYSADDQGGAVYSLALSPDGSRLASAGAGGSVVVRESGTGAVEKVLTAGAAAVNAVTFDGTGRRLAAAGADRTIRLFDASGAGDATVFSGHANSINSLSYDKEGRLIASGSEDGSVRLWDSVDGSPRAVLTSLSGSNDWLVVTPDGLFDGSPSAWGKLLWRFGGATRDVAPVEAFFNEFFYPGVLSEVVSGARPAPVQAISKRDRRQPVLHISSPGDAGAPKALESRDVRLRIEVKEEIAGGAGGGSGAKDLRLFRNGSLVKIWRGDVLGGRAEVTVEATVPLVPGPNRFTAYAFNRDNVKSADAECNLDGAESLRRGGTAYILAIGVNSYANSAYNLRYALPDARDFSREVGQSLEQLGRYERVEVVSLFDGDATKANVLAALRILSGAGAPPAKSPGSFTRLKHVQPDDAVVVYFAGHGTTYGDRFYLIPHDIGYTGGREQLDVSGLQSVLEHSISDNELQEVLEDMDVGKLLLVIDACNSGQALEAEEKRRGPMNSRGLAQLAYEKGMYILTASQGFQVALEAARLGHGYLTYALVEEGLKTRAADANGDRQVMLREWMDYATARVPQMQAERLTAGTTDPDSSASQAKGQGPSTASSSVGDSSAADESGRLLIQDAARPKSRGVQRPRSFYRRELEMNPLIVAKGLDR